MRFCICKVFFYAINHYYYYYNYPNMQSGRRPVFSKLPKAKPSENVTLHEETSNFNTNMKEKCIPKTCHLYSQKEVLKMSDIFSNYPKNRLLGSK